MGSTGDLQRSTSPHEYDLVCVGRAAVDLYSEQIGCSLEDVQTFAKYVGGCAANIAIGSARLGLKVALLSRVGNDHMGRYVRKELARSGVTTDYVTTDPERPTGLVLLAIENRESFPLLFYRDQCADMAIRPSDIPQELISSSTCTLVTGTHFSQETPYLACLRAIDLAKDARRSVVFDIDYRPVLWGLADRDQGHIRYVPSADVSKKLQTVLDRCDLVVGTEDEIRILGGSDDLDQSIKVISDLSEAHIIVKRGASGSTLLRHRSHGKESERVHARGYPIEVTNVLGAGDAFLAGFLRGWLREESDETSCSFGNACGAIVVSRHGCAPAMPSMAELNAFISSTDHPAHSSDLHNYMDRLHCGTQQVVNPSDICSLAFDHRQLFEAMAGDYQATHEDIRKLKQLIAKAVIRVSEQTKQCVSIGMIVDDRFGQAILDQLAYTPFWIARPIERPNAQPLAFEGSFNLGLTLRRWPRHHVVKCVTNFHPKHEAELKKANEAQLKRLAQACQHTDHQWVLEILPQAIAGAPVDISSLLDVIKSLLEAHIVPDWWKIPPLKKQEQWIELTELIQRHAPHCLGVLILGMGHPLEKIAEALSQFGSSALCRGFAVGRSIFGAAAEAWFAEQITDDRLVETVAERYKYLVDHWAATSGSTPRRLDR